jgi:hypothetical protein
MTTSTESGTMKIVLKVGPSSTTIGVEAEGCDPVFDTVPITDLAEALEHVEPAVARARAVWQERRQGPAYQAPTPSLPPPRAQPAQAATTPGRVKPNAKPQPTQPTQQQLM